jgi:hypothetical protein
MEGQQTYEHTLQQVKSCATTIWRYCIYNVMVLLAREEIGVLLGAFLTFFVFSNGIRVVDDHINYRALLGGHAF